MHIRRRVSSEDTKSSGSRFREGEVRSPFLLTYVVTLEEDEVQSSSTDVVGDGDGTLREGEEDLTIMNGLMRLQVGSSLGSLIRDYERRWRNPLFEPPPLRICNQEERIQINEESVEIGVEE
jgi:hypothetical protein